MVIAIIGILVALLLPAVQGARESARSLQCKNNVKQMSLACLTHENSHGHLPATGWHYRYVGDPEKGFRADQPGGWHYNILPFMEQLNLHSLGSGLSDTQRRETGKQMCGTVVDAFICPSRGVGEPIPFVVPSRYGFSNINRPVVFARSDYAANAGNRISGTSGYNTRNQTGVMYSRDGLAVAAIHDGMSNTYLLGERYISPDHYKDGYSPASDQGWAVGHDHDVIRWTDNHANFLPRQDTPGAPDREKFGSAHAIFHMAMCDGSVRGFNYSIELETHHRLGHRNDGQVIDMAGL